MQKQLQKHCKKLIDYSHHTYAYNTALIIFLSDKADKKAEIEKKLKDEEKRLVTVTNSRISHLC